MRAHCINPYQDESGSDVWLSAAGDPCRGRRLYVDLGDDRIGLDESKARELRDAIDAYLVEQVPFDLTAPDPITDDMCAAAMAEERSRRWHSDELRVWAMLAAAREAAPASGEKHDVPASDESQER